MPQYDEILDQIPVSQLAAEHGVTEADIREAAERALPALLGGLRANAADPAGAQSIAVALSEHQGGVPRDLGEVDVEDGRKIVANIYGDNTDQVMSRLGGLGGGVSGELVKKLLPILAPIVLSWLAGKLGGRGGLGGILGDLLGGQAGGQIGSTGGGLTTGSEQTPAEIDSGPLFPGGQGSQSAPTQPPAGTPGSAGSTGSSAPTGSNPIQDVLGDLLGGGSGGGGGLGGILGDLFGSGRRA
ncbi:DUF937 domain-containing protein [Intrasporangium sp. DVR]|uniref:DUF937 domain-containing protein n=1 Tax=Intrasporangium sp. DVR TaxID=3127867 RepID=UPI00313A671B